MNAEELAQYLAGAILHGVLGDAGQRLAHYREVAEAIAKLPIVFIDTEDDFDPFYSYQEEMTHLAEINRITYGEWIRRELNKRQPSDSEILSSLVPNWPSYTSEPGMAPTDDESKQ